MMCGGGDEDERGSEQRAVLIQQGQGALVYRCAACVVMHVVALVSTGIRQLLGFQAT
jgi:Zn-finger protein